MTDQRNEGGIIGLVYNITPTGISRALPSGRFHQGGRFLFLECSKFAILVALLPKKCPLRDFSKHRMLKELTALVNYLNNKYPFLVVMTHINSLWLPQYCNDGALQLIDEAGKWDSIDCRDFIRDTGMLDYGWIRNPQDLDPTHFDNEDNKKQNKGKKYLFAFVQNPTLNHFVGTKTIESPYMMNKGLQLNLTRMNEFFDKTEFE